MTWLVLIIGLSLMGSIWSTVVILGDGVAEPWLWSAATWQAAMVGLAGLAVAVFASLAWIAQSQSAFMREQEDKRDRLEFEHQMLTELADNIKKAINHGDFEVIASDADKVAKNPTSDAMPHPPSDTMDLSGEREEDDGRTEL